MIRSFLANPISNKLRALSVAAISLSLFGAQACVTVNVNFPEGAVQKQTDDYVKDLYRARERKNVAPASVPTPSGPSSQAPKKKTAPLMSALETLVLPAFRANAEDTSFNINTAEALNIKESLRSRVGDIIKYKKQGFIGETKDGMVRTQDSVNSKPVLKKLVDDLVATENNDRGRLYQEVMKSNQLAPSKESSLKSSFSRSFQNESPSGTWVQDSNGSWSQKP